MEEAIEFNKGGLIGPSKPYVFERVVNRTGICEYLIYPKEEETDEEE